jgi:hypothetical protein
VTLYPPCGSDGRLSASVSMPPALGIETVEFVLETSSDTLRGDLPVVRMEGISHIIIEPGSAFFELLADRRDAENAARLWCEKLGAYGLGLMFLKSAEAADEYRLTPLVYIPESATLFWENSCASGSSAVGMYLASKTGVPVSLALNEPGGILHVESDPESGLTRLRGKARLLSEHILLNGEEKCL